MIFPDAACATHPNPDIWYAPVAPSRHGLSAEVRAAIKVCETCPARRDCLEVAMRTPVQHDFGVWGATTPAQRAKLRTADDPH